MEGLSRVTYDQDKIENAESDIGFLVKHTLDRGLNDGVDTAALLNFRIPPDHERYTDLNSVYLKLDLKVTRANGAAMAAAEDQIFLDPLGIHSLFSSCEVSFNGVAVSNMSSYPYTSKLLRYFGSSFDVRENVWDSMDASWSQPLVGTSNVTIPNAAGQTFTQPRAVIANSMTVTLYGRINADVFTSARQFLPPGIGIGIDLRRSRHTFSLLSAGPTTRNYDVNLLSASVFARRYRLGSAPRLPDHPHLVFNRLESKVQSIPAGSNVWTWHDCLNGGTLPNRIYLGFVTQQSLHGHLNHVGTYFEPLNLSSLNVKVDGRDVLVEPIRVHYERNNDQSVPASNRDKEGFLSIMETLGLVGDQMQSLRLKYNEWQEGMTIYAIELGKSGEMANTTGKSLDLELSFGEGGTYAAACLMLFTEKTETVPLTPIRRL